MKKPALVIIGLFFIGLCGSCRHAEKTFQNTHRVLGSFEDSLVSIQISSSWFDGLQPWKRSPSQTNFCCGTAVGPDEIVTIAEPFAYASFVQVKTHRSAEYIPARIKAIDYDLNLCLLQIDRQQLVAPLLAVPFSKDFGKGLELNGRWLSSDALVKTSRGFLDRAVVRRCPTSYQKILTFVLTSTSRQTSRGELYTDSKGSALGIAFDGSETEAVLLPGETINLFLTEARQDTEYKGYGTPGYETYELVDPAVRKFLKMPEDRKDGCFVSVVYTKGTGSEVLKPQDVILEIDGNPIDAFGRCKHPVYEDISYEYLIQRHRVGEPITFTVFREGKELTLQSTASRFDSADMLVPYQEYGKQPKYFITGGYIFQKLTLDYLRLWGENWQGKVPPHLLNYYRNLSMNPPEGRKEVVILSFVLPAEINLGYQNMGRIVVKTFNGVEIKQMSDILTALNAAPESPFHVVEFEMNYPTVVIPKDNLEQINQMIFQLYGIPNSSNIN
ncbi:MAG TPA: hypothetical protein P5017_00905 [Anaerohalosphaeraceae bacterium]|nr:hypothetical protein [Anaerohalosphaeraceae bacterium]